ncbi:hypothetical protein PIB30_046021 [Stylosanthes scabra]|uniref:Uncharacterized protein n=1 Tax=Stylosanthes scabra TaxID=79078 RepID=A0ABU6XHP0_9FABA|nr:hypothetical protein [Stylosanthes scabra]
MLLKIFILKLPSTPRPSANKILSACGFHAPPHDFAFDENRDDSRSPSSHSSKRVLLGRGAHTLIKSVSFSSPIDVGLHNPPPNGAQRPIFGFNCMRRNLEGQAGEGDDEEDEAADRDVRMEDAPPRFEAGTSSQVRLVFHRRFSSTTQNLSSRAFRR